MKSGHSQTPQNVEMDNQSKNQPSNQRSNDDLITGLRHHLNPQQNQQNQRRNNTSNSRLHPDEQAHHPQIQNPQDCGVLDRMDESQDDQNCQDRHKREFETTVDERDIDICYSTIQTTDSTTETESTMEVDPDTRVLRETDQNSRQSREVDACEGPSKKKTRDNAEVQEDDAGCQLQDTHTDDPNPQMDTDDDTIRSVETPLKSLVIEDEETQKSEGNTTAETSFTRPKKVSYAAVEVRMQSPAWMGEVTLPTEPQIRLRLRDPSAWAQLVTDWLNGVLNPDRVRDLAKFEAQLILQEQLSDTVPEGNWSGYTTIYQAQAVFGGLAVNEARVDLSNQRQRQNLRNFLSRLMGHEDVHEKIELARSLLAMDGILPEPLPTWALFNVKESFNYCEVPPISWWTQQKGYAMLTGMSNGRDGFLMSIDDVDRVIGTAKIIIVNGTYQLIAGAITFRESVLPLALQKIEEMGEKFRDESNNPPPFMNKKFEDLERMCVEIPRVATHAFISNIPKSFLQDHRMWKSDMMFAMRFTRVRFSEAAIDEAMRTAVVRDEEQPTFSFLIPTDGEVLIGTRDMNSHFLMKGPDREKVASEMRQVTRTATSYLVQLLTQDEFDLFAAARVQCVFRGATMNSGVNQLLRLAVMDFFRHKNIHGRLVTAQSVRHKLLPSNPRDKPQWFTEMMLVVYVLENASDMEVKKGHDLMGFTGPRFPFNHNGIRLEAYKNVEATDHAFLSVHVKERKPHLMLQSLMPRTVDDILRLLFILIPAEAIDYWAIIDPLRGSTASMIVGLRHQISTAVLDNNILYEMVRIPEDDVTEFQHLPHQAPPDFLYGAEARPNLRPPRNTGRAWSHPAATASSMTDNEDIIRRITALESGLAEQQSQTMVVRSNMSQETVLRQQLQTAYHAIKTKFDQIEERQQALETKAGNEFLMLQKQMAESQGFLIAMLGDIKGDILGLKTQRNDRRNLDPDNEL